MHADNLRIAFPLQQLKQLMQENANNEEFQELVAELLNEYFYLTPKNYRSSKPIDLTFLSNQAIQTFYKTFGVLLDPEFADQCTGFCKLEYRHSAVIVNLQ